MHIIAAAVVAVAVMAWTQTPAQAAGGLTHGCSDVNAGGFNQTHFLSPTSHLDTISGFSVGDTITITVSGSPGNPFQMRTALNTVINQELWPSPATQTYTVTGANGDTTLSTYIVMNALPHDITIVATCVAGPSAPGPNGSNPASALVAGFLSSRINGILMSAPSGVSVMNRGGAPIDVGGANTDVAFVPGFAPPMALGAAAGSSAAIGRGASRFDDADESTIGSRNVQFRNSLSQMRREATAAQMEHHRMALGAGNGGSLPLAYETASPWDIWVEGRYSAFDDDNGNLGREGHVGVLYVGGDYRVTQNMIVGVLAQFDWAKDDSGVLASKVDGKGWLLGPYMSARIHDNIYLDLRAAWGRSSNDIDVAGAAGSFDTSRWLVKGTLAGNWQYDAWRITPSAELAYITESASAFTNSAGTFVAGQDVSLGRLQFGPEVGYRFAHTADTFIEPFAAIKGVWDFDNPNVAIINGVVVGPGEFWGRLQGGLNVMTTSGVYVRGLASWDGIGAGDYNGYTLQGTVNVPLN